MSDKLLEEMVPEEFEEMLETFISREEDEVEVSAFFEAWARIEAERRASAERIYLRGEIVGDRLIFAVPEGQSTGLQVRGNEIVLEDGRRIVLELKPEELAPA
jgi:hypothetical protein